MKTKTSTLSPLAQEMADVQSGKATPGRVWIVTRRPDGTVARRQTSRVMFKRKKALEAATENSALPARRKMGVSQDRFAELLGISAATVRNIEQGRTKPTGPTSKLLSIAEQYPQIFVSESSSKLSSAKVQAALDSTANVSPSVTFSMRKAQADNRRDEFVRRQIGGHRAKPRTKAGAKTGKLAAAR